MRREQRVLQTDSNIITPSYTFHIDNAYLIGGRFEFYTAQFGYFLRNLDIKPLSGVQTLRTDSVVRRIVVFHSLPFQQLCHPGREGSIEAERRGSDLYHSKLVGRIH